MMAKVLNLSVIIISSILLVSIYWQKPTLLLVLIFILSLLKHFLLPIKYELKTYVITSILGPLSEHFMMLSGPWQYTQNSIFNFPIWLPFLWGLAGTLWISIYQLFEE